MLDGLKKLSSVGPVTDVGWTEEIVECRTSERLSKATTD